MRLSSSKGKGLLLFALFWIISACTTLYNGDHYNGFGPLLSIEERDEYVRYDMVGPFFTYSEGPGKVEWGLRPFLYYLLNEEEGLELWEFIYPLGRYRIKDEEKSLLFAPLISSRHDLSEGAERPSDFGMFPVFWGKDREGNPYGGVFPFYGTIRNKYGRDYIRFIMWPFYSESRWGETKKTSILWPIFSYTEGPNREGIKVWPIFGWDEKENEFSHIFALWPIFFYQKSDLHTERPSEFFSIFPFYIRSSRGSHSSTYLLWPLFHYERDKTEDFLRWDIPWPFLGRVSSLDEDSFHIWPIYGYKKRPDSESHYFLWPIYRFRMERNNEYERISHKFLLLSQYSEEYWKDRGSSFLLRIWPILFLRGMSDGELRLHVPEIIPIEDEGFDRNWGPILRPFTYHKDRNGNEELSILWGLYHYWKRDKKRQWDLSFFLSIKMEERMWHFSLMKGLFEYRSNSEGKEDMRILYLPWLIPVEGGEKEKNERDKDIEGGGF